MNRFAKKLAREILRLANANSSEYLVSLNLKKLNEGKRPEGADPRAYYTELREKARKGPLFCEHTIGFVNSLNFEMDKQETQWVGSNYEFAAIKQKSKSVSERGHKLFEDNLRQVLDYVRAEKPELHGLTFDKAVEASEHWHEQFKGKSEVGLEASNGYTTSNVVLQTTGTKGYWVDVPLEDLKNEGNHMGHCVGGGGYDRGVKSGQTKIYSFRDSKNEPHVTIEVDRGKVVQIQGKQNERPVAKYDEPISELLEKLDTPMNQVTLSYVRDPKVIAQALADKDYRTRAAALESPLVTREMAEKLLDDDNYAVQHALTNCRVFDLAMGKKMIAKVIADSNMSARVVSRVVRSKALNAEALNKLCDYLMACAEKYPKKRAYLLSALAEMVDNPNAPPELTERLMESGNPEVLSTVCHDRKSTPEVLNKLLEKYKGNEGALSYSIGSRIARHKNSTPEILEKLYGYTMAMEALALKDKPWATSDEEDDGGEGENYSGFVDALKSIAQNKKTRKDLVNSLADCNYAQVHRQLVARKDIDPKSLQQSMLKARAGLKGVEFPLKGYHYGDEAYWSWTLEIGLTNPKVSAKFLAKYATDKNPVFRAAVAKNVCTSVAILRTLSADASAKVRKRVAGNENTPMDVLKVLLKDPKSERARRIAQRNINKRKVAKGLKPDPMPERAGRRRPLRGHGRHRGMRR